MTIGSGGRAQDLKNCTPTLKEVLVRAGLDQIYDFTHDRALTPKRFH